MAERLHLGKPREPVLAAWGIAASGVSRTKTIPHAFGERAVLKLMFTALARASQTWRRPAIGQFELKQIEELKTELQAEFRQRTTSAASPTASRLHFSGNNKT